MTDKLVSVQDIENEVHRRMDMQDTYLPIHFLELLDSVPARCVSETNVFQNGKNCTNITVWDNGNMVINM